MVDSDDDAAPAGYSRPVSRRLLKDPPPEAPVEAVIDDEELKKAAKATAAAPAAPAHGRPKRAGNALAFPEWQKKPPT
jgi:hypothetical protein